MPVLNNTRLALCLIALLAWCHGAMAQDWYLIGLGKHQETGRDIYLGGIYLKTGTPRPTDFATLPDPWKMEYRIVARRTSIRSLLGGMLLQSEVATGRPPGPATTEFADGILSAIGSSLYAGDAFDIVLDGNITYAVLNGQRLTRSTNPGVASYFLMGWISEQGAASSFRNALLAPEVDPDLLAQQSTLDYSVERGAEVASWLGVSEPAKPEVTVPAPTATGLQTTAPDNGIPVVPSEAAPGAPLAVPPDPMTPADRVPTVSELVSADQSLAAEPLAEILQSPLAGPGVIHTQPPPADPVLQPVVPFNPTAIESPVPTAADEVMALGVQEYSQRLATFQSNMVAKVYSKIRYPKRAVRRNLQGRLELDVVLSGLGELRTVEVVSSSGHVILDNAAVDAAEDAFKSGVGEVDPVARVEFGVGEDKMIVPVPVQFRLQ